MTDGAIRVWVNTRSNGAELWHRLQAHEDGEGVISAAIAVLIMAFLGAGMWFAFNAIFNTASGDIADNVGKIGGD